MFEDFVAETVDADGLPMFVRHAGSGPVVLLLHGHPRTSATWHRVAPALVAQGFTVVCPVTPEFATQWWHWFFFAQPEIPERVINADPDSWYHGDPLLIWRDWARDVTGHGIDSGHHVAELSPAELTEAVGEVLRPLRTPRSNSAAVPGRLLS